MTLLDWIGVWFISEFSLWLFCIVSLPINLADHFRDPKRHANNSIALLDILRPGTFTSDIEPLRRSIARRLGVGSIIITAGVCVASAVYALIMSN